MTDNYIRAVECIVKGYKYVFADFSDPVPSIRIICTLEVIGYPKCEVLDEYIDSLPTIEESKENDYEILMPNYERVPNNKNWSFEVELMKSDEPDFIVLIERLYKTIDNPWELNEYVSVKFSSDDGEIKIYNGHIINIVEDKMFKNCYYNGIKVRWDDSSENDVSPWEMEYVDVNNGIYSDPVYLYIIIYLFFNRFLQYLMN